MEINRDAARWEHQFERTITTVLEESLGEYFLSTNYTAPFAQISTPPERWWAAHSEDNSEANYDNKELDEFLQSIRVISKEQR